MLVIYRKEYKYELCFFALLYLSIVGIEVIQIAAIDLEPLCGMLINIEIKRLGAGLALS